MSNPAPSTAPPNGPAAAANRKAKAKQAVLRVCKEVAEMQKGEDFSIAVHSDESDVRKIKALIVGPPDTPYEMGFFDFQIVIGDDYPASAPTVTAMTTNLGTARFNPNIYSCGKVCLSILGTWRGEPGEQWSPAQGLESVLISIQSLMSSDPYSNEPGFDTADSEDAKSRKDYASKIRHETIRIAVLDRVAAVTGIVWKYPSQSEPSTAIHCRVDRNELSRLTRPDYQKSMPFAEYLKQRFCWYYDSYEAIIAKGIEETNPKDAFPRMPFESPGNGLVGEYNYPLLQSRLRAIKDAMLDDLDYYSRQGLNAIPAESDRILSQFTILKAKCPHELTLEDNNPFVWNMTYFGQLSKAFEGGFIRVQIVFPLDFPTALPIVKVVPPIFHLRVATDGTLCYHAEIHGRGTPAAHIKGILECLDECDPSYDPRTRINIEAHKLYWGSEADRKVYNRKLRRSIEDSMEG